MDVNTALKVSPQLAKGSPSSVCALDYPATASSVRWVIAFGGIA